MKIESCPSQWWRSLLLVACLAVSLIRVEAGSIQVPAWTFDRGNAEVRANPDIYADYRDPFPDLVVVHEGPSTWRIEYDVDFPTNATYTLHIRYGSPEKRPMEVWVDDKCLGEICGRVTGNAPPYMDRHPQHDRPRYAKDFHGVEWEEACTMTVTQGKHTLKFTRRGPPPRISALRLESPEAFPKGWKPAERDVNLDRIPPTLRRIFLPPDSVNTAALRPAIEEMIQTFGPRYPRGGWFLERLTELEKQPRAEEALKALQREALLAHPALKFDRLLFLTQHHRGVSVYTGHNSDGNPGGNLCVLFPVSPEGKVTELVPELAGGVFGRFNLSFDATRIIFCHARDGGQFRIYEINIDPATGLRVPGRPLRQITFDCDKEATTVTCYGGTSYGKGFDDIDPCYLPNGQIMFASTRAQRAVLCAPTTATTLHVMDADGKNIRCISSGQVNELAPCLLDDGRVAYTRWEYIDKGFGNVQSLWTVRPDGSGSDHLYKNTVVRPGAMINAYSIPGSRKIVTIGIGHHGGLAGPVILLDTRRHRRTADAMHNLTPEISYPGLYPMKSNGGFFREPYPFSEKFFLVSHHAQPGGKQKRFGLYVLDGWGNRAELYHDADLSCFQPVPLRPRARPTAIPPVDPPVAAQEKKSGTMFLHDVYQGLTGIERGRIKYLRVMEAMNLSWHDAWRSGKQGDGAGMQASAVSGDGDVAIKKIHGIVNVYQDGSACFTVPAEKNIFLQALDENYMEIQRMRTFINLMPGEQRSCVGCHEFRRKAPNLMQDRPEAMDHPVQALKPQPGDTGPRTVHYVADIQPLLDKHCIGCHGEKDPRGDLNLTHELTEKFSRSYDTLKKKKLVSYLEGGFGSANVPAELPMTFGSHQSPLVERIRKAPCKAELTREEMIRIVTWIDANAPYYGTHRGKKNLKWKDDPDFRPLPLVKND